MLRAYLTFNKGSTQGHILHNFDVTQAADKLNLLTVCEKRSLFVLIDVASIVYLDQYGKSFADTLPLFVYQLIFQTRTDLIAYIETTL
ncbi:unnamed protein product [Oikopleura dioica]|uniref:Uncharacterized protein n=1 Tax=Oikopleura dioica TaxID=34765 RepID=E4YS97_OIKDI|nr:unnamed protein product [Oikopleura dioica]